MIQAKARRLNLVAVVSRRDVDRGKRTGGGGLQDEMAPDASGKFHVHFVAGEQMADVAHLEDIQRYPVDGHEDMAQREGGGVEV